MATLRNLSAALVPYTGFRARDSEPVELLAGTPCLVHAPRHSGDVATAWAYLGAVLQVSYWKPGAGGHYMGPTFGFPSPSAFGGSIRALSCVGRLGERGP